MHEKDSKIYIAGHSGLTGSALMRGMEAQGYTNLIVRTHGELDLLQQKATEEFFRKERPEYVVMCAARVGGIQANIDYPADFLYQNLQIQNNIIWSAHTYPPKKLLFLGSTCIYPRAAPQPMREEYLLTGPLEPTNESYAIAKIAGIKLCEQLYHQYGNVFISCVPPNLYGPDDNFDPRNAHVIPSLIGGMHRAKTSGAKYLEVWGDGTARREFLYIDDFAQAVIWLLQNYNKSEFLNIGTGHDVSIRELSLYSRTLRGTEGTSYLIHLNQTGCRKNSRTWKKSTRLAGTTQWS